MLKKIYKYFLLLLISGVLITVIIEGGLILLYHNRVIELIDEDKLIALSKDIPTDKDKNTVIIGNNVLTFPFMIPHPYFGSVYTPNNRFTQSGVSMQTNSEGFVDIDFPISKEDGVCVYALLGGSAAMSWGAQSREERINYQLESLLNEKGKNSRCNSYRVLNMAIGGHTLYQATMIYLYYKSILDGAIFYHGNNECSHGSVLFVRDHPISYPTTNIETLTQWVSPFSIMANKLRVEVAKEASDIINHEYREEQLLLQIYSFSAKYYYNIGIKKKLSRIQELNVEHQAFIQDYKPGVKGVRGKHFDKLRTMFPKFEPMDFWYGENYDMQKIIMKENLPVVFTEPITSAYGVAKLHNTHFLSIIQPMSGSMKRKPSWRRPKYPIPTFQKTCMDIYNEESQKIKAYGIETHNLNDSKYFENAKDDIFLDGTHITPEGNKHVADILFELIQQKWNYSNSH